MKTKFNLFPPAIIVWTDALPDGYGGMANGPVVRILPKYDGDLGIVEHELFHVMMWWAGVFMAVLLMLLLSWPRAQDYLGHDAWVWGVPFIFAHDILCVICKRYRIWNEAHAYAIQMKFPDAEKHYMTAEEAALHLVGPKYNFGLTMDGALEEIAEATQTAWE